MHNVKYLDIKAVAAYCLILFTTAHFITFITSTAPPITPVLHSGWMMVTYLFPCLPQ
jgi:hypothetical protein